MSRGISINPRVKIKILIVDDDSISLAIVSSMLKTCSLQDQLIELSVITVRNGKDALSTIQAKPERFDLVIIDVHVPGINGYDLQKQIHHKFCIPVIFMFSDGVESIIAKSLGSGALFHIVKPVKQQDIKKAWQGAIESCKKTMAKNKNAKEEIGSTNEQEVSSASSVNEESSHKNNKGKKRVRDGENEEPVAPKKAKIIWTNSLHNRFLQAINHIGLEKAVPKRILEFMNVPGLTRENVASHLQKYRMFLKKVAERGLWTPQGMSERILRSSFATGYNPSLTHTRNTNSSTFDFSRCTPYHHEASSSNSPPLLRPGQSSLLGPSAGFHRPQFAATNPFNPQNNPRLGMPMPLQSNNIVPPIYPQNQNFSNSSPYFQSGNYAPITGNNFFSPLNSGSNFSGQVPPIRADVGYGSTNWANQSANDNAFIGNGLSSIVPKQAARFSSGPTFGDYLGTSSASSLFGSAAANYNQISGPFNVGNQEIGSSMLNPLISQQNANVGLQNSGGNNDFGFSLFNDVFNAGGASNNQHVLEESDLDLFFGSVNPTTPLQQQNVEGAVNTESLYQPELNPNDFLNVDFSNSCTIVDKAPSNDHSSQEIQSAEETVNANSGSNGNIMDSYFPSFDQAQTQSSPNQPMDSDLIEMAQAIATSDENQGWGDNLMDILLGNHPY